MPIAKYFRGKGEKVMADMKDRYGAKDGERAFYATANKKKQRPEDGDKPRTRVSRHMQKEE